MTRARTWSLNRSLEWARRLGASPPKRMTASWSGSRVGPPNTRLRRDLRALWRAPLGSLAISQATAAQPPRPKPWRPAHTLRDGPIPFRYVTENRARQQVANPLASTPSATPNDKLDIAPAARPNNRPQDPLPSADGQTHQSSALVRHRGRVGRVAGRVCRLARRVARQPARCATAEALQAIVDLDLDALTAIVPPRGYGRD